MSSNNIREVTKATTSLPRDYYAQNNLSIYDLLKLSGYFDAHNEIGEAELAEVLANEGELVTEWLRYSGKKRNGSGWYIVSTEGGYIVGHLERGKELSFSDRIQATAFFVKQELESIRKS